MPLFVSKHVFSSNRAYYSEKSKSTEELKNKVTTKKKEFVGAGFRSYGNFIGFILSCLRYASKINFGDQELYVNNKSFCKYAIRRSEAMKLPKEQVPNPVAKLDELYIIHQKTGYDKKEVSRLENRLKDILLNYDYEPANLIPAILSQKGLDE